jgi:hypothetical protein
VAQQQPTKDPRPATSSLHKTSSDKNSLMHILVEQSSDSGNNRSLPQNNKTYQPIIHQVDSMVRGLGFSVPVKEWHIYTNQRPSGWSELSLIPIWVFIISMV